MDEQGARYAPIRWEDRWFRGEDKRLRFKVTLGDDITVPDDLATWTVEWYLRDRPQDTATVLHLSPPAVEIVTGDDPDDPEGPNIELVQVSISRTLTEEERLGTYHHALVRVDSGDYQVLAEGEAVLRASAAG